MSSGAVPPVTPGPAAPVGSGEHLPQPGPVALVGSGEYLAQMTEVERLLIAGRGDRYVQLPTAAGPEGEISLGRWMAWGGQQAERLGVTAVPVLAIDRASAEDPLLAAQVVGAGLVYLSGGNPTHCSSTLRGSAVWAAVLEAWRGGAALAGCSAGAMALTAHVPDLRHPLREADPGLGVVPNLRVIPHFDRFLGRLPDLADRFVARSPDGVTVLGLDEDTALVWLDGAWTVHGRQQVWVLNPGAERVGHPAGTTLDLPPPVDPAPPLMPPPSMPPVR